MTDNEKFEGFKKKLVEENEATYGEEVREKYGDKAADTSNAAMMDMSEEQYSAMQELSKEINALLERAVAEGVDPKSEAGQEIAKKHKQWISQAWGSYNPEAHKGVSQMYVDDPRFTEHYDGNVSGCALFLRDAVHYMVS